MKSPQQAETIIIGAGLGGLAAAIRLAAAGRKVTVFDSRKTTGGKAGERILEDGSRTWRFDSGPSLLTLVNVLEDLFEAAGRHLEDYLQLIPLNPVTHYWFADGTRVQSSSNLQQFGRSMEEAGICTEKELKRYLAYSRRLWKLTHTSFLERSLHEISDLFSSPDIWKAILQIGRIDAFRSMDAAHGRFFSNPKARQFFNRYATYNGSNPYRAPATLNNIPHVEFGLGGWAVKNGIAAIPAALEKLARELGVRFRLEEPVLRILTRRSDCPGRVRGILTDRREYPAGEIICNADVTTAYQTLLKDSRTPLARRYRKLSPSSSGLVFFWAMDSNYPELGIHNIFFSKDYNREFKDIFAGKRCPLFPTVYVNITSKVHPPDAPVPGENWFVLVNAPPDEGQNWQEETDRTRRAVLQSLERALARDIETDIVRESILTPPDIAAETSSRRGSLYGISSNSRTAAFLRHPNKSRRYPGLYFCGGSAHPGGGMPLVMLSGKIAANLALKHGT